MTRELSVAVTGAILGLILGILGCLVGGIPFPDFLFRIFFSAIAGTILLFVAFQLVLHFLPELIESSPIDDGNPDGPLAGSAVDLTVDDEVESPYGGDQAAGLRAMRAPTRDNDTEDGNSNDDFDDDDISPSSMVQEVREQEMESSNSSESGLSFNEDAFYSGIEQLPDIGGFSEQFSTSDSEGMDTVSSSADFESASHSLPSKSGGKSQGSVDPQLMAQAIRSALKKDS